MTDRVITARNLSVTYRTPRGFSLNPRAAKAADDVEALRGVSFDVSRGEAFGVIGRNGAGKSTLLRVLAKTLIPDQGTIEVQGKTSTLLALGVGFNPNLTGHRNIILGSLAAGLTRKQAEAIKPAIVEYAELGNALNRPLSTYSRGQQSRLAFAIARNLDPDVLLIDEVLAVGDEAFKQKTLADMRQLLSRSGTIVFVSHALGIIREFCDRVLWLDNGETMQIGEPNQIVDAYRNRYVRPEFDLVRDVTGGRDGVPAELIRSDRSLDKNVSLPLLRASRSVAPAREYVDLDPLLTPRRAAKRGRRLLASGWKDSAGNRLAIEAPLHWERHNDQRINTWEPVGLLLAAYQHDGYERMLRPAIEYAVDWIRSHDPDPLAGGLWSAGLAGRRAYRLAALADVACRVAKISDDDVRHLVTSAIDHARILEDPATFDPASNAAIYQIAGMFALALSFPEIPELEKLSAMAGDRLDETLETQFTRDGVHRRHSPLRHSLAAQTLGAVIATGVIESADAAKTLVKVERALEWFVTPTGHLAGFGDIDPAPISDAWDPDPSTPRGDAKRVWRTGPMRHAASRGVLGKAPEADVRGFRQGGYFVVKTRDAHPAHLAMQCGFHSDAGKEADDLSIIWHDADRDLLVDAGRYWGDDPAFRKYSMSTRAHNTVEIDGRDHGAEREKYRSALDAAGTVDGVHYGTAAVDLDTVTARRLLAYAPGRWLLVFDTLRDRGGSSHQYRQWFHAAPEIDITATGSTTELRADGAPIVHATPLFEAAALAPTRGALDTPPQGWHSPGSDVVIPNWAFGWEVSAADRARFAVVFSLDGPVDVVSAPEGDEPERTDFAWSVGGTVTRIGVDLGESVPITLG